MHGQHFFGGEGGVHTLEFLFNFSRVTQNAFIMIKLLITKLKHHRLLYY